MILQCYLGFRFHKYFHSAHIPVSEANVKNNYVRLIKPQKQTSCSAAFSIYTKITVIILFLLVYFCLKCPWGLNMSHGWGTNCLIWLYQQPKMTIIYRIMLLLVAFSRCFFKYLQFVLIFDRKQLKLVAYVFSNNQNKVAKSKNFTESGAFSS